MGLFDFVKNAGARIFGREPEPEKKMVDPEKVKRDAELAKAQSLRQLLEIHGFEVEDPRLEFRDSVATVFGKVQTQTDREKVILALGNVNGVAQVDDRLEVVQKEPEAQFYTVKSGDTLSKIAKEFYGSAMKYPVIFDANRPMLEDPDKIYPGQVLRIPSID